jgi:hypothetical protein
MWNVMAEGGATQSARLLLRRFSNYKWIVQNFNLHSRGRPLAPFVGALDSRRFSTRRPVILFLPIKHFSFYATAALRTSSFSVRYESASAGIRLAETFFAKFQRVGSIALPSHVGDARPHHKGPFGQRLGSVGSPGASGYAPGHK